MSRRVIGTKPWVLGLFIALLTATLALAVSVRTPGVTTNPLKLILDALTKIGSDVETVETDLGTVDNKVSVIESEVLDPEHGLGEIKKEIQAIEASLVTPASFKQSSGLFALPANAVSVDWMAVNNSTVDQTITVWVYKMSIGTPKVLVGGSPSTPTIRAGEATHNANSVGAGLPFEIGYYYEVVVEIADPNVLTSVQVWQDNYAVGVPGTLIPSGSFVRLK